MEAKIDLMAAAEAAWKCGIVSMPVRASKRPNLPNGGAWGHLYKEPVSEGLISALDWDSAWGIAYICGKNSKNLFCIDIDSKNDPKKTIAKDYCEEIKSFDKRLFEKFVVETSQNGGYHLLGFCDKPVFQEDLAKSETGEVILETRGHGEYFVGYPSLGYELKRGNLESLYTFEIEWVQQVVAIGHKFDRSKPKIYESSFPETQETKPGADYDLKMTDHEFLEQIKADGFKEVGRQGQKIILCRPGKKHGTSATFNSPETPGKLYIFSSSTDLPQKHSLSPFSYLTHKQFGGNFSECAKHLASQGYGDYVQDSMRPSQLPEIDTSETYNDLVKIMEGDFETGVSTGWASLDELLTIVKGQLNIVSGYPAHGKSEWVDALMVNLAELHGFKILFSSAENWPIWIHKRKIAEKHLRMNIWKIKKNEELARKAACFIDKHFSFIKQDETVKFESILKIAEEKKPDVLVIDPWNEIDAERPNGVTETDYIGRCLKKARLFGRNKNMSVWIVAHPTKTMREKDGAIPVPTLYDIHGSANWFNKADNGIVVFREKDYVKIYVQKVKFRYFGKPGDCMFYYDTNGGIYIDSKTEEGCEAMYDRFSKDLPTGDQL